MWKTLSYSIHKFFKKNMIFIAIVGRSNVGKSTIFNKLTNTKDSLVTNVPNSTRDRKYGLIKWKGNNFCFIDTGGIKSNITNEIEKLIHYQSKVAIDESHVVLLVVDHQSGPTEEDKNIVKFLQRNKKNIILIINKIENFLLEKDEKIWYSLSIKNIISVPNIKKINKNVILKGILLTIEDDKKDFIHLNNTNQFDARIFSYKENIKSINSQNLIKISIVGKQNVGKSTLFNCIFGKKRTITYDEPGTTKDSISCSIKRKGSLYTITDTAGIKCKINKTEKCTEYSIKKTFRSIHNSDIVLFVIDVNKKVSNQDFILINFILKIGKPIVIAINKWDSINKNKQEILKKEINLRLQPINFINVRFISAIYKTGINSLFRSIDKTYKSSSKKISTSQLNKTIQQAIFKYKQPNFCKAKIKYAHIGGYNPLIIIIHGKRVINLPNSYKEYLKNYFYQSFNIVGIAINLQFRNNDVRAIKK